MEQHDYIKRQIDQLTKVLGKIFANLLQLRNQGELNNGIEIINQTLKDQLNLDIDAVVDLDTDTIIAVLKTEKSFNNESLSSLADILLLITESQQEKDAKTSNLLKKCLTIYTYLNSTETTYSFDRHFKVEKINKMLEQL